LYLVAFAIPVLRVQLRFVNCINKRKKKHRELYQGLHGPRRPGVQSGPCRQLVYKLGLICPNWPGRVGYGPKFHRAGPGLEISIVV